MNDETQPLTDAELGQLRAYCANNDSHGPHAVGNLTNLRRLLTEVDRLRSLLDTIQELHKPFLGVDRIEYCDHCYEYGSVTSVVWPCDTARALERRKENDDE